MTGFPYGGKWGFVDNTGRFVIEPEFERARDFSEGVALVRTQRGIGYIDRSGKIRVRPDFTSDDPRRYVSSGDSFSNGLAAIDTGVGSGPFYGYIDKSGQFAIPPRFHAAGTFSEGLAPVAVGDEWGYIDPSGRFEIKPRFADAKGFSQGLARVQTKNGWAYVDPSGTIVIGPEVRLGPGKLIGPVNDATDFSNGLARVHVGGQFELPHDASGFWTGGAWYYIDKQGLVIRKYRDDQQ